MVTIGIYYRVTSKHPRDVRGKLIAAVETLRRPAGPQRSFQLWQSTTDEPSFLLVSDWRDEGAFVTFTQSKAFADFELSIDATRMGRTILQSGAANSHILPMTRPTGAILNRKISQYGGKFGADAA